MFLWPSQSKIREEPILKNGTSQSIHLRGSPCGRSFADFLQFWNFILYRDVDNLSAMSPDMIRHNIRSRPKHKLQRSCVFKIIIIKNQSRVMKFDCLTTI